jgi:hypothetical protein
VPGEAGAVERLSAIMVWGDSGRRNLDRAGAERGMIFASLHRAATFSALFLL